MSIIWKKEPVRIHRGQIPLRGDSYDYLSLNRSLGRKIRLRSSCLAPFYEEVMDNGIRRIKLDYTDLFNGKLKLDNKQYLRIGHQKRRHKIVHRFVVYLPKWFREKYCIPGGKDHFLPKIELQEDAIYLYVIEPVSTETKEKKKK